MIAFSINQYITMDITEEMRDIIEQNCRNTNDTSSLFAQEVGDVYLRMVDKHARKKVSKDVAARAYILKAKQNNDIKYAQRYVPIISDSEAEDEEYRGPGVSENVLGKVDTDIDSIADSDEFKNALKKIIKFASKIEIEDDIDLFLTMYSAYKRNAAAVDCLKGLTVKYADDKELGNFGDVLYTVLSGEWTKYINVA